MRTMLAMAVLLSAVEPQTFELPGALGALLEKGTWDATPRSFRIIALSHVADGCVGQAKAKPGTEAEARACLEQVLAVAKKLGRNDDGLFLSHLNLIYGALDRLGGCANPVEHERLSRELASRSVKDPLFHASSYGSSPLRWPADQTVTLASLARFDAAHGTRLLDAPLTGWKRVLENHLDAKTGLPESELTGKGPGAKHPRGCAQSYITRYLAEVDAPLAATWWGAYRTHFLVRVGPVVGFREWPPGVERKGDVDSGPIVFGVGAAASAFALAAAKAQGDAVLAGQLAANETAVMATGVGGKAAKTVLAEAISFQGRWQPMPAR